MLNKTYLPDKTDDNSSDNSFELEPVINILIFFSDALREFRTFSKYYTF